MNFLAGVLKAFAHLYVATVVTFVSPIMGIGTAEQVPAPAGPASETPSPRAVVAEAPPREEPGAAQKDPAVPAPARPDTEKAVIADAPKPKPLPAGPAAQTAEYGASSTESVAAEPRSSVTPFPAGVDDKRVKDSLVNIYCKLRKGRTVYSVTGSGAVIDPKGVILTSAHVAQYFLLERQIEKGALKCYIRGGNPARKHYTAEVLFIPPSWIEEHYSLIVGGSARGTGEGDYAFLRISGSADGSPLPQSFSYLAPSIDRPKKGATIVAAGYPAEFIPDENVNASLYGLSYPTTIADVFTFGRTTVDVVAFPGGYLAQKGSSGGPVINEKGAVIGVIATASKGLKDDNQRSLNAITTAHIERSLVRLTDEGIEGLLEGDLESKAYLYARDTAPALEELLEKGLREGA